ncbi:T9SS type A sorting domain-containing protein, partial [Robiginitalea aurantiaca]
VDTDGDGVPDGCDICGSGDDSIDTDGDGVPDNCDICEGSDDSVDTDGDGVPDGCDICDGSDDTMDTDGDGVPNGCDLCEGFDDSIDKNGDGIPDRCENEIPDIPSEKENNEFIIYPNPTRGIVNINLEGYMNSVIEISIFDTSNRRVFSSIFNNNHGERDIIDLYSLPVGLYYVLIEVNDEKHVRSIVISR